MLGLDESAAFLKDRRLGISLQESSRSEMLRRI